ncbi:type I phosphomannose isomerase catalytic subunit [Aquimarina celericrescens]|uniref:Phosphohexomutase n=1 Tax=Aquimarina celericrescens TaxID=1964542 RepID=A0ABW5AU42_9FLAO|nr:class I mannose-6-phosphate isomerase [Aquimarina celericrescens]
MYPLKFYPILKEKIWGGDKLKTILNKPAFSTKVGESWEVSAIDNDVSIVSNGTLEGKSLIQLINEFKDELLGEKVYQKFGNKFPLLIKFIDAKEDLSVQLHPEDKLARERHDSFGKTEMWYVVQADQEAKLIIDFNKKTTKEEYQLNLSEGRLMDLLNFENIYKGDSFIIKAGTIHAIGKGTLIAEIQQTSDITYRVYDWDRKDNKGNKRELHTDLALEALNFENDHKFKLSYSKKPNHVNEIISAQYFTTNFIYINKNIERNYKSLDTFIILICVEGKGEIIVNDQATPISIGETVLIPSVIDELTLQISTEIMKVLEVYIK